MYDVILKVNPPGRETPKAYGFMGTSGEIVWVPKSQCKLEIHAGKHVLFLTAWIEEQSNITERILVTDKLL